MDSSWFSAIIGKIPSLIEALVIVVIFWFLSKILRGIVVRKLAEDDTDDQTGHFIAKIVSVVTMVVGLTIGLKLVGIDMMTLVGFFGLGIGFALQDIIKNFLAGVMMIIQKSFKVGDAIKVGEYVGKVESIGNRATSLKTFDGQRIILPNNYVYNSSMTNFSSHAERRMAITTGVTFESNLVLAAETIMKILQSQKILAVPAPQIIFEEFYDSQIILTAQFWINTKQTNMFEIKSTLIQEINKAFEETEGIAMPYLTRTIKIDREQTLNVLTSS